LKVWVTSCRKFVAMQRKSRPGPTAQRHKCTVPWGQLFDWWSRKWVKIRTDRRKTVKM
jgi:hypothetical protein